MKFKDYRTFPASKSPLSSEVTRNCFVPQQSKGPPSTSRSTQQIRGILFCDSDYALECRWIDSSTTTSPFFSAPENIKLALIAPSPVAFALGSGATWMCARAQQRRTSAGYLPDQILLVPRPGGRRPMRPDLEASFQVTQADVTAHSIG